MNIIFVWNKLHGDCRYEDSEHFVKVVFPFGEDMEKADIAIFGLNGDEIKRLRETEKITRMGSDRKGYWKINSKL